MMTVLTTVNISKYLLTMPIFLILGAEAEDTEDPPPKFDSSFSIDIPNSVTLWESNPRPARTEEVRLQE